MILPSNVMFCLELTSKPKYEKMFFTLHRETVHLHLCLLTDIFLIQVIGFSLAKKDGNETLYSFQAVSLIIDFIRNFSGLLLFCFCSSPFSNSFFGIGFLNFSVADIIETLRSSLSSLTSIPPTSSQTLTIYFDKPETIFAITNWCLEKQVQILVISFFLFHFSSLYIAQHFLLSYRACL